MNDFFDVFTPFVSCVLNFACMQYFFSAMSGGRKKGPVSPVGISCFVIFLLTMYFVKEPLVRLTLLFSSTVAYTFLFNYKFYNRIFISVAYIALCSLGENIMTYLALVLWDINFYEHNEGAGFLAATVMAKVFGLIMLLFVVYTKKRLFQGRFRFRWLSLYSLPISTVLSSITLYYVLEGYKPSFKLSIMGFVSMILLVASNFLIFKIVDRMHEDIENESKLKFAEELVRNQTQQYDALFNSNREVYKIQHDNKNFLLGVVSELESGNTDSASSMLKGKINTLTQSNDKTFTGNSVADTILGYKLSAAKKCGIKVDFEHKNIMSLKLSGVDFAILLGNALDNAIEASEKLPEDKRCIKVFMIIKNDRLILNVSNNVERDIDTQNLKTLKNDTDRHGFGIINMQNVASKYNGDVVFECKDNVFSTIVSVDNAGA